MKYAKGKVVKHIDHDQLKRLIRKEKNKHRFERLVLINRLYLGDTVPEACKTLCISNKTGYEWLRAWNEKGYEGLDPDFAGGRPSMLTSQQKGQLREKLAKGNWLTTHVRALIKRDFGVSYSIRQTIRILRELGMNYAKPYALDYRKPDNAAEILRESIREATMDLPNDSIVGFLDEASPQTTDNRQRVWSFGKPRATKNTTRYKANTFGFYPINGKPVVDFKKDSKISSMCGFLRRIRDKNPGKHILVFADNFATHKAEEVLKFARSIGITLVFLPKYSPDLNPIEFIWKSIKRILSGVGFIRSEWSFRETIRTSFYRLARSKSFMAGWLEKFGDELFTLLCH